MNEQDRYLVELLNKLLPTKLPSDITPEAFRRLEIILRTQLGQSQSAICRAVGCSKETARYWMSVAKTDAISSWSENRVGRPRVVNDLYLESLRELVSHSPQKYGYSFKRWTAGWLSKHLAKELGIEISDRHVNRLLKQMGLSTRGDSSSQNKKNPNRPTITIEDINPALLSQSRPQSQSDDESW
ncbi:transposase [Xenococcus sp. PCC 7305]|uniref:helix-turn-helix domain-containing protein n=1 Tax=Xenococcus sp. PCC 7305 TaxID=102125 RepID=UPI0002AC8749|nr:helix-turn-helix domain-containing protein [Xenococcus sp. PCC 7305]ELS05078.1 transposase [Xenococcus sp. PCC 7305]